MKKILTLTAAAILLGTASFAAVDAESIASTFVADGYTNLDVTPSNGNWLVTALKGDVTVQFMVDGVTGAAVPVDTSATARVSLAGTGEDSESHEGGEGSGGDDD